MNAVFQALGAVPPDVRRDVVDVGAFEDDAVAPHARAVKHCREADSQYGADSYAPRAFRHEVR